MSRIVPLLLLFATVAGCKFPLATAYRTHSLYVLSVDGADTAVETVQRMQHKKCPAAPAADRLSCLRRVRKPVAAHVNVVKPILLDVQGAWWLALEATYYAKQTKLDDAGKAALAGCAAMKAAAAAVQRHRHHMGAYATGLLTALHAGSLWLCSKTPMGKAEQPDKQHLQKVTRGLTMQLAAPRSSLPAQSLTWVRDVAALVLDLANGNASLEDARSRAREINERRPSARADALLVELDAEIAKLAPPAK